MSTDAEHNERVATVDVSNFEILGALREPGCALCRVQLLAEQRMVQSFLREGRYNPGARKAFMRSGGLCQRHAWQFHGWAEDEGTGAGIADVYKQLIGEDLGSLDESLAKLKTRRGRRRVRRWFGGQHRCPICVALTHSQRAHGYFLGQLLGDQEARSTFTASDGLCYRHLEAAVAEAMRADGDGTVAGFLVKDWRARIQSLGYQLAEYDRKRDYRYAAERRGEEQQAWTEVIRALPWRRQPTPREATWATPDSRDPALAGRLSISSAAPAGCHG